MRKGCIKTLLFLSVLGLKAQLKFQSLRYNEDYTFLKNDTLKTWYLNMKFKRLNTSSTNYLSQGGEIRYLYQHFTNEDWGGSPAESYNSFYTRFLYHTDVHVSEHFRFFTQLNSTFAVGRVTGLRQVDQNVLDVQQVFFDLKPSQNLKFRFGRQELLYGSQRLIAVREGPNNRQSYDAAKLIWTKKSLQLDVYYSHPVRLQQGMFDDYFNETQRLWSVYTVMNAVPWIHGMDLYYIGSYHQRKEFNAGVGEELRHSVGTRIWRKSKSWNYDIEALYQFGSWANQNINAYTVSMDLSYTLTKIKTQPCVGLKTEVISGDNNNNDNQLNTFNALFPKGAYFGLAALIGPVNLLDVHPNIGFSPAKGIEINADYDVFWRYSFNDGIYGPNVALIYGANSKERFIGHQVGLSVDYQLNAFLKLTPELMWFYPGPYLKEVSPGKQVFFVAGTLHLKF